MNEQELKQLAEWAGFTKPIPSVPLDQLDELEKEIYNDFWIYPDGTNTLDHVTEKLVSHGLPYFPKSLDACFKWLVPKLEEWSIASDYTHSQMEGYIATATVTKPFSHNVAHAETPALALCLAIEKLIVKEINDSCSKTQSGY